MRHLFIIVCFLLLSLLSFGQQPQVLLQADTLQIRMGEQIKLKLSLFYDTQQNPGKINWPAIPDSISAGKVFVVEQSAVDTTPMNGPEGSAFAQHKSFLITAFDSGSYTVGPFGVLLNGDTFFSNTLDIGVMVFEVDTTKAIKDIKGIEEVPYTLFDWIVDHKGWLLFGAALLIVGYLILSFLKKRRKQNISDTSIPEVIRPAHEIALEKLETIRRGQYWQRASAKAYYTDLSIIVREYVEKRFSVFALELTTHELLQTLQHSSCAAEEKERLRMLLSTADMVKFAKQQPDEQQSLQSIDMAIKFVQNTKEEPVETPDQDA